MRFTEVYNNEKDQDILIQLGDPRKVAANFESFWHGASGMILTARPYIKGIIRQLENDGKEADAKKIDKLYQSVIKSAEKLSQAAVAILLEAAEQNKGRF